MATYYEARTIKATKHGTPGREVELPAGITVTVMTAYNLPDDSPIKYWVVNFTPPLYRLDERTHRLLDQEGIGLHADDVKITSQGRDVEHRGAYEFTLFFTSRQGFPDTRQWRSVTTPGRVAELQRAHRQNGENLVAKPIDF